MLTEGLVFASTLWIGTTLQFALDSGGWPFARAWLVTLLPSASLIIATVAVPTLFAGWAVGAHGSVIRARQWVPIALACGIGTEGCLAAYRLVVGPAASTGIQAQRYYLYLWAAAAAGGLCALALCWLDRVRGVGLACLAAPLATLSAVAGFLVLEAALGPT
jgi:hypothetical protein